MGVAEVGLVVMVEESLPNQGAVGSLVVVMMMVEEGLPNQEAVGSLVVVMVVVMVVVVMVVVVMVVVVMMVGMVVASSPPKLQEVAMGFPVVKVTQVV